VAIDAGVVRMVGRSVPGRARAADR
jgi:hypothetical protein